MKHAFDTPDTASRGRGPLSSDELRTLDTEGFVVLPDVLGVDLVRRLRRRLEGLTEAEGLSAGAVDQTPLQLWANRSDLSALGRSAAAAHGALFRTVHLAARAGLFRWKPELMLDLMGRAGSPGFAIPRRAVRPVVGATFGDRVRAELREMLAAAAYADPGAVRLADLVNKGPEFLECLRLELVLEAVRHAVGPDIRLSSLNYRAARPDGGLQALHVDWDEPVEPGTTHACNCLLLLDDFVPENGATRVVPGSHRSAARPQDALADPVGEHPDQVIVSAPAGSAIVLDAHVWHGGTLNRTSELRRVLQCYLVRAGFPTQLEQGDYLRPETAARLTPELAELLGV